MIFHRQIAQCDARVATKADLEIIRRLLNRSLRAYTAGDNEALDRHIAAGLTWVLNAGHDTLAFVSADMRSSSIAAIVAAAVGNGEQATACAERLLPVVEDDLVAHGARSLVHIGHAPWLTEVAKAHGFRRRDAVVTYGWNASRLAVHGNRTVTVRPAEVCFLEDLVALDKRVFGDIWHEPVSGLRCAINGTADFTVATEGERIVGYQWHQRNESHGHLARLAVSPEWQGKGVGTRLFTEALVRMVDSGIDWITLNTQLSNKRSRNLYERFGFQTVGLPAPVMWKDLREWQDEAARP